ncbi:MAG: M15 family metallopeptidase [Candidatus Ancillula sp.]|jgi:LAS superfamily LD-carboxypeptidase LdcB|nr:M15 family metallopeptidase [Candidatus Ancillula sp.]
MSKKKRLIILFSAVLCLVVVLVVVAFAKGSHQNAVEKGGDAENKAQTETQSTPSVVTPTPDPSTTVPSATATNSTPETQGDNLTPETASTPFFKNNIIVVNKKHPLPQNWAPGENAEAVTHLRQLIAAAQNSGDSHASHIIEQWSGYRSFATQANLYSNYVASSGAQAANTYSAKPGYSEHQTGLAFDLKDSSGNLYRINDPVYDYSTDWVALHAHEYGFIVRYRDEWTPTTGYVGEPWHLRYLGVETATAVRNSGKTLEEFLGVSGGDYAQ